VLKFPTTLRTRIAMMVLIAVVPLLGLSLFGASLTARDAISQSTKNAELTASLIAANEQLVADSAHQVLSAVALVQEILEGKESVCQRYFKSLSAELQIYTSIGIIGTDGHVRCHSTPDDPKTFVGDLDYFQSAMASGGFVASSYLVDHLSGKPVIKFALPVKGIDGSPRAVVFAAIALPVVAKNIASMPLATGGRVVLMNRDGVVLAANPDTTVPVGMLVPIAGVRDALRAGVASVFEDVDASGNQQIYAFRPSSPLPNSPFFVLVSVDRSEVLAPARQQLIQNCLALVLLSLFGGGAAWLLAGRTIVQPAGEILKALGRFQAGALDVRIPLHPGAGANEMTRIATGFNGMAEALQTRDEEQAKIYAQLRRSEGQLLAPQEPAELPSVAIENAHLLEQVRQLNSELRLSNQELEAFSYSVSHDLRAPLNTIDGFSRLVAKQIQTDADAKTQHYLSRIQAGVAQMGKQIEGLLAVVRASRTELRLELVDLSVLSRVILGHLQARDLARRVELHIQPGLVVQGDASLLRVLMENLLSNAWKFTSHQTDANITVGQQADAVGSPVFFVRDDGAGFDMAYANKLFIAFQRLHAVSEFPGTGVGLATASRVVARHGGQLWADASPGKGATFFFTLPSTPAPRVTTA
jgi:signal transduction histidine kinase